MTRTETPPAMMTEPITAAQRRALFAAGRVRGLTIDDIRGMTPTGSISALTRGQASDLLEGLNRGTEYAHPRKRKSSRGRPRRPKGVYAIATEAQHRKIESLRIQLGWTTEGLRGWLSERHYADGRAMTNIDSTNDGRDVIELLKGVLERTEAALQRGDQTTNDD